MDIKSITMTCALVMAGTAVSADVVSKRQDAMDQIRFGAATLVPMLKGKTEFDAAKAELALRMTYAGALGFENRFPEGSASKGANPAIWENKADFDAKLADFISDGKTALGVLPQDLDGLKAAYQPLLDDCAACHKAYRIK